MTSQNETTRTDFSNDNSFKVAIPFYVYAAISFLLSAILLLLSTSAITRHYFMPPILAITHTMALGWGTMMILGASHQLIPVIIERKLYSNALAHGCFWLAALGIPLLVYGFFVFDLGWPAKWGGRLIIMSVILYLINLSASFSKSRQDSVQGTFIFTAVCWLLLTTVVGLILLYNFTVPLLPEDSLHYLPLHAHIGIVGWFLLTMMGVGSKLIPLFLLSKYSNSRLLWWIYALVNSGLLVFVVFFFWGARDYSYSVPVFLIFSGLALFGFFCWRSYQQRIRRHVDSQMKMSLLSVLITLIPMGILSVIMVYGHWLGKNPRLITTYGFTIFFGWITVIILGMTFKTLPFIVWNKIYHATAGVGKTPSPKDLLSSKMFAAMAWLYAIGFGLFTIGILTSNMALLNLASTQLLLAAVLYNLNVFKILFHKQVNR